MSSVPFTHASGSSAATGWGEDARVVVPALVVGLVIVAGVVLDDSMLALAGALAAIATGLIAPAVGLAMVVFTGPLEPPLVIPTPGFKAVLVVSVLLGCVYRLPIDRPRIRLGAPLLVLTAFVMYVAVSQTPQLVTGYAGDVGYLVYTNFRELMTGFGMVLAAGYVLPGRSVVPFLVAGLASASLSAAFAVLTFGTAGSGALVAGLAESPLGRASAFFGNPNYFGMFAAVATVTAVGCMMGTRSSRLRAVLVIVCLGLGAAVAVSLSRGAVVALAAGLAALGLWGLPRRTAILAAGALVATAVVVFPLFVEWRIGITDGNVSSTAYTALSQSDEARLAALLAGPRLFLTSPLFGVGWAHYSVLSAEFAGPGVSLGAHNWYMAVLAELGAVGIAIWTLLLGTMVIALRKRPSFPRTVGFGVLAAYVVGCLFLEAPNDFQTSSLAILVLVAAIVGRWPLPSRSGQVQP